MSRFSNVIKCAAVALLAAACTPTAKVDGTIASAPSSEVVMKLLNVNRYEVLDTVNTDASGRFTYRVKVEKGQPEFVYVYHNDTRVASLLLEAGDKVNVVADTLGNYSVEGSAESARLAQVEKEYSAAQARLQAIADQVADAEGEEAASLRQQLGKEYVDYYRKCVRYILENSRSLTVVPVLYQNFGPDLPVFAQSTDAIHFVSVADSLALSYPQSKYVKALKKEAERRFGYLELEAKIRNAAEIGYPDVVLPDVNAEKIRLSEVDAEVIMLYFWSATDANQKMFNLDVLKSLYEDYHSKGFEIYQVALDPDKTGWAQVVKQQNLPWINVCDGLGASSPYVTTYNIPALPATYIIADGELVDGQVVDEKSLRRLLDRLLK
ncbi:MAG: TlpA family protein disulfide reductase [Bacteroidales bacterium]|nr:TlpA family protein disulfide reductase [Bacteroidales bacterium]